MGKKSFFTMEIRRQRVILYLSLDPATIQESWASDVMRDVTEIGHYGMGDAEYSVRDGERVGEVRNLIKLAYERI